ncbi:hypothetical protein D3C78_869160 [compost metagenome]
MFVLSVEYSIGIAVQIAQRIEAVFGLTAISLDGVNTKKLAAVINQAVTVPIAHKKTIVGLDPACASFQAIAIKVEDDTGIGGEGLYTIVIEIKREWVRSLYEIKGSLIKIICRAIHVRTMLSVRPITLAFQRGNSLVIRVNNQSPILHCLIHLFGHIKRKRILTRKNSSLRVIPVIHIRLTWRVLIISLVRVH